MTLADKIIKHRRKNGWSQEELAEKLGVSRQAVSKWESAQSVPELEKLLQLSYLFGVSTDYLVKDDIEDEQPSGDCGKRKAKKVTVEEAEEYIDMRRKSATQIALGVLLCILSPVALFILSEAVESGLVGIGEDVAGIIGICAMFAFVLSAVPIFIWYGFKNEMYIFLDKNEPFELENGVRELVEKHKKEFRNTYVKWNITATCLCVFAPIPLIISGFWANDFISVVMLALMMAIVGAGVYMFITVGVRNASMQKLLCEGEYTRRGKRRSSLREAVGFAYWGIITAIYLVLSFTTDDWHIAALVFAVGTILFPVAMSICNRIADRNENIDK